MRIFLWLRKLTIIGAQMQIKVNKLKSAKRIENLSMEIAVIGGSV